MKKIYVPVSCRFENAPYVFVCQNGDGGMSVFSDDMPGATQKQEVEDTPENRKAALAAGGFYDSEFQWHGIKRYYLIPGNNFDRVGFAANGIIPEGKNEITREEAIDAYRNELEWEIGSGYIEEFDVEAEMRAAFGE